MKAFILFAVVAVAFAREQCGENEHYNSCGTDCPLTCDNYANPPKFCNLMCRIGCECDAGYVRSSDGRCVRPEECPARYPEEQECGPNQHYTTCGTACPLTCDNYANPPKICVLMCKIGCACDEGFVLTRDGKCIRSFQCPQNTTRPVEQTCTEKPDPGMCLAYFPMWYYDAESGSCKEFVYGGCQGNGNRYKSQEECLNRCQGVKASPSACTLPAETGVCRGLFPRYFFDVQSGTCKQFIYGGCGGNENNFESAEACESTCGAAPRRAPQACLQDKITGPCKGNFSRFFFNKETGQCEEFVYGGCGGNSNNFNTHDECEAVCSKPEQKTCLEEPDGGLCRGYFEMYYYDYKTRSCKTFIYGGCMGNGNRYGTEEECLESCSDVVVLESGRDPVCEQFPDSGNCHAYMPRYYFDKYDGQCKRFMYSGCGGNGNNFITLEDCENRCKEA